MVQDEDPVRPPSNNGLVIESGAKLSQSNESLQARSFSTSPERLAELATCKNLDVRLAVARNLSTSVDTLLTLAQDPNGQVRMSALVNKNLSMKMTRPYLLQELKLHPEYVLSHRHANEEIVDAIAVNATVEILPRIAQNRRTSVSLLAELSQHELAKVRGAVFANPKTPSTVLANGVSDEQFWIRVLVAQHRNLTDVLGAEMLKDTSMQVIEAISINHHIAEDVQNAAKKRLEDVLFNRQKAGRGTARQRAETIVTETISWEFFNRVKSNKVAGMRIAVKLAAYEQGLINRARCLYELEKEKSRHVVFSYFDLISPMKAYKLFEGLEYTGHLTGVLRNDWIDDRELLERALETKRGEWAWDIAQKAKLDSELLDLLADADRFSLRDRTPGPHEFSRWPGAVVDNGICQTFVPAVVVAMHPKTAPETMAKVRKMRGHVVRAALVSKMQEQDLAQAATSKIALIRVAVARNPLTSLPVLTSLAMDKDPKVRAQVLESQRVTPAIRAMAALVR